MSAVHPCAKRCLLQRGNLDFFQTFPLSGRGCPLITKGPLGWQKTAEECRAPGGGLGIGCSLFLLLTPAWTRLLRRKHSNSPQPEACRNGHSISHHLLLSC